MAKLRKITSATELEAIREIYIEAFPPEERRPWEEIASPDTQKSGPKLMGIYHKEQIAGLVAIWDFEKFIYIEHLAVDRSLRGSNIGGRAIDLLKLQTAKPLLLEVEPAESNPEALANRRINFYRRHGFDIIGRDYIQPPYGDGLPPVPLWLMSTGPIDPAEATVTLHKKVYGQT